MTAGIAKPTVDRMLGGVRQPDERATAATTSGPPVLMTGAPSPPGDGDSPAPPDPSRRRPWPLLAAIALAGAGVAAVSWSSAMDQGSVRLVGANRPVNSGAVDPADARAQNSPSLRVSPQNPAHLAVVNRIDSPSAGCALHVSLDGGGQWQEIAVPVPEGRKVGCYAPDAVFGADGTFYVAFTSWAADQVSGTVPDAVWLSRSTDGGRTMSGPAMVAEAKAFQVRLAADRSDARRLYLTWVHAGGTTAWGFADDANPIVLTRSDDGGASWAEPSPVSSPSRRRVLAPTLAVDGSGAVHLAYLDVGDDRLDYRGEHEGQGGAPYGGRWSLVVARSGDGGRRFEESVVDDELVPTQRVLVLFPPAPALALDRGGQDVYVSFHDGRYGDPDVLVWRSTDGGRKWRSPARVNDTPYADGRAQYLPQLAVAPDGRLDVVYYDRRNDAANRQNAVSLQSSFDGGGSFEPRVVLTDRPFDSRIGIGAGRNLPELGDRLGLVATDQGALAVWTDTRAGAPDVAKQDLAAAVAVVINPDRLRSGLRAAGVVAVAAGGVLSAWWVARRRARAGAQLPQTVSP